MIFRSWPKLNEFVAKGHVRAREIRDRWCSEFEQEIVSGNRGVDMQDLAIAFQRDLMEIPPGEFKMGTPEGKTSELDPYLRNWFQRAIDDAPLEAEREEYVKRRIGTLNLGVGRGVEQRKNDWERFLTRVLAGEGMELVRIQFAGRRNEHWHKVTLRDGFQLSRRPCINAWYRLYDSLHGCQNLVEKEYRQYSLASNCPAIFVDWYSAWAFCQWARWQELSCCLPTESQWEYACKFGSDSTRDYWWGEAFDDQYANALNRIGHTTSPAQAHSSPATMIDSMGIGLMDMLGNVCEWTQSIYRSRHDPDATDDPGDSGVSRVLRGGAFSSSADLCRSAYRDNWPPSVTYFNDGFRVSRARKS